MTSFKNLKIDYLSLNLQVRNIRQINKIADFLANLGCKSTLVDESERKSYVLTKIHKHRYSAEFVVNLNKYWKGTTLRDFSALLTTLQYTFIGKVNPLIQSCNIYINYLIFYRYSRIITIFRL